MEQPMTSDDQRRAVTARLHKIKPDKRLHGYVQAETVFNACGIDSDFGCVRADDLSKLADLIDRPTCQMKSIPNSSYSVCSRCGAFVREGAVTNCTEAIPARFCPNCAAMVVEKEKDDGQLV